MSYISISNLSFLKPFVANLVNYNCNKINEKPCLFPDLPCSLLLALWVAFRKKLAELRGADVPVKGEAYF